ncbi:MAG: 23S rRNA pseudouridylate synthase B, partial [Flavobacteriaceae bacterium]|nr:23S rRNA pseudouridylate synthase B [Flavobacteriaceae bacterium]
GRSDGGRSDRAGSDRGRGDSGNSGFKGRSRRSSDKPAGSGTGGRRRRD